MKNILLILILLSSPSYAELVIEITKGAEGALPIAIVPFSGVSTPQAMNRIIANDLRRSGYFKPLYLAAQMPQSPRNAAEVNFNAWRQAKQDYLVIGQVQPNGPQAYLISVQLFDVFQGEQLLGQKFSATTKQLRAIAHHIADLIYETLTGKKGVFATRIAYVVAQGIGKNRRIELKIADSDGHNPVSIVSSKQPIMSPAWSPDGKKIAYVSFEGQRPSIWVQTLATGQRKRLTHYPGINGAPAWSPNGRYLAMTLSKDGNPDIYILDLQTQNLQRVVRHEAIDTEPAWSPDGKKLLFTSDRGGSPQIYELNLADASVHRITFEGSYNAKASYAPDGQSIVHITRIGGQFRIALLDLNRGSTSILSQGKLDESPSFAPNGSMIIYASQYRHRGILTSVAIDGGVEQRYHVENGDVRDPVWSPYLNQ